eukprot:5576267-Pyramimonas_sp.AAC.1
MNVATALREDQLTRKRRHCSVPEVESHEVPTGPDLARRSVLAEALLLGWAEGEFLSTQVQKLATYAVMDGGSTAPSTLQKLA